jgi:pimeloyl-ACP methyl ester carboxylesterase
MAFSTYGELDDEHWQHIARHSVRWDLEEERYIALVDPKVMKAFRWLLYYQMTLWNYWRNIKVPMMTLRGVESDFLPSGLVKEMRRQSPQLVVHDVEGVGHMPMLMKRDEIEAVSSFLGD